MSSPLLPANAPNPRTMISEFKNFLLKQNIVALAIAVVVGAALNRVVQAVVDGFIMPIVAIIMPGGDWQTWTWHLGAADFKVGEFFSALVNFLIVGFVAWRIAKLLITETAPPPTKTCTYCRSAIDPAATRCPNCTSQLAAA